MSQNFECSKKYPLHLLKKLSHVKGHLVRKHPEHVSYVGDAVAHTKLVTQDLEAQMVTVKSKIEEEKQKAEEFQRKNKQLAAQARGTAIYFYQN